MAACAKCERFMDPLVDPVWYADGLCDFCKPRCKDCRREDVVRDLRLPKPRCYHSNPIKGVSA